MIIASSFTAMDTKLAKTDYSPGGYWKGITAIKKLAKATKVPEETVADQASALADIPPCDESEFLAQNLTFQHPTRSTRRTFFFCHVTNCPAGAKFSNMC